MGASREHHRRHRRQDHRGSAPRAGRAVAGSPTLYWRSSCARPPSRYRIRGRSAPQWDRRDRPTRPSDRGCGHRRRWLLLRQRLRRILRLAQEGDVIGDLGRSGAGSAARTGAASGARSSWSAAGVSAAGAPWGKVSWSIDPPRYAEEQKGTGYICQGEMCRKGENLRCLFHGMWRSITVVDCFVRRQASGK